MATPPGNTNFIPGDILSASQYNTTNNAVNKLAIEDNERVVFPGSLPPADIANGHWVITVMGGDYSNFPDISPYEITSPSVLQYNSSTLKWTSYPLAPSTSGRTVSVWDNSITYNINDYVTYKNAFSSSEVYKIEYLYRCKESSSITESPESTPSKWERVGQFYDSSTLSSHIDNTENPHNVTKTQLGLDQVDNTSDLNKPISSSTQIALNTKTNNVDFTGHTFNSNNPHSVTKVQLGLSQVDNTTDLDKPISTATQAAINLKANAIDFNNHVVTSSIHFTEGDIDHVNIKNKGVLTHNQIDSHILSNSIHFTEGAINHANITNIGTNSHSQIDTHISNSTVHFTEGSINHLNISNKGTNTHAQIDTHIADATKHFTESSIDHTNITNIGTNTHAQIDSHISNTSNPHSVDKTDVGLANVDNTSDLDKPISTATQTALDSKLDIESDYLDFDNAVVNPLYKEGRVFYDNTKKAVSYYNDKSELTVNLGQEVLFKVENQTGGFIPNGTVICPDITTVISLADAYFKDKSRIVAVTTQDIDNGDTGYATKLGQVGGLNTSAYVEGEILYLGTDGQFTNTTPIGGGYIVVIGVVDVVDATEGIITVDTKSSDLTVEVTDTNGFPTDQRTNTTLSFVEGTRTFTIAPVGVSFHYYQFGDKFLKTSSDSIVITDVTGGHLIYYDGYTLSEIANPTEAQAKDIILNKVIVSYVYWNSTTAQAVLVWDERHGINMSPTVHEYLHSTRGSQFVSGLALNGIIIDNGSLDSHAQFGNVSGSTRDEDIDFEITSTASTIGYEYLYRSGASGYWVKASRSGFSFPIGATPLPQYNQYTGATYQLTEVTSGNFMLIHVFGSNNVNLKPLVIIGDSQYTSVAAATTGANDEVSRILTTLPLPEFVPIGSIILEGKTNFTNSQNTRIVQTSFAEDYKDWRTTELSSGAAPTNHNNLSGLQVANTGVNWGHVDNNYPLQLPSLTTTERDAVVAPNAGMIIYNSTTGTFQGYTTSWGDI